MNNLAGNFRQLVLEEYNRRFERNRRYSIRAFASDLNISKTALSDQLAGRKEMAKKSKLKVLNSLGISNIAQSKFLSVEEITREQVCEGDFKIISQWYHLAILNLIELEELGHEPRKIAKRLAISEVLTKESLDKLLSLNLITIQNDKLVRTGNPLCTSENIPSQSIREHHRGNLKRAEEALDFVNADERDISTLTFIGNKEMIKEAQKEIRKIQKQVENKMKEGHLTDVYSLCIQLFPQTKNNGDKNES